MMNDAARITRARVAVCLLSLVAFSAPAVLGVQYKVATVPEKTLRKFAKIVVMPKYPDASQRAGAQGVAVAHLDINEEGTVSKVELLEAPDEATGSAVVMALKMWTFERPIEDTTGKPIRLSGKLTFYFVIENGHGVVRNPK